MQRLKAQLTILPFTARMNACPDTKYAFHEVDSLSAKSENCVAKSQKQWLSSGFPRTSLADVFAYNLLPLALRLQDVLRRISYGSVSSAVGSDVVSVCFDFSAGI